MAFEKGQDTKALISELERRGYKVKPGMVFEKKTLDINPAQWREVMKLKERLQLTQRTILFEALSVWLEKRGKEFP